MVLRRGVIRSSIGVSQRLISRQQASVKRLKFLPRSRFAAIERQGLQAEQAQRDVNIIINKINTLSNLNEINAVLNNAPANIRSQVAQIRSKITGEHNDAIRKLQGDLQEKRRGELKFKQRKEKEKNDDRREKYNIKEDEYNAEAQELEKFIGQMKRGNLYSYKSVLRRANAVGKEQRLRDEHKVKRKAAEKTGSVEARKATEAAIRKEGFTPIINYKTNEVIGYQTGKSGEFQEFRFDKSGKSFFYKSPRFTPVIVNKKVIGYKDTVLKRNISRSGLEAHIKGENIKAEASQREFKQYQTDLNKINLPTGYSFQKDNKGNIININDNIKGVKIKLENLPQVTNAWILSPNLTRLYGVTKDDYERFFKSLRNPNYVKELRWYEKFSPKKWLGYVEARQYNFYKNNFNGKLSKKSFNKLKFAIADPKVRNSVEGQKMIKALNAGIKDQIQNPEAYGTTTRLTALLSTASGTGLPTLPIILFGASSFGVLGLAKDVSKTPLPKNFKSIAAVVGKNFGIGAVQGLLYGLAFTAGAKILGKFGRPLLKMSFGAKGAVLSNVTRMAIRRGLSILGVNYISRMAGRTTHNIKNIVIGEAEVGVAGLSKDVGILVGFTIPIAAKKILDRKNVKLQKRIIHLEKLRRGQTNAAFIKAKNAQLRSDIRGKFISKGSVKKLDKTVVNNIFKQVRGKGITKAQLLDGSYYVQTIKVRSDVPKTEALIKILKGKMKGKTIKIKSVPKYYTFKRYGIVVAKQLPSGEVKAFAIEFNKVGRTITHIGFKTATGKDKITAIKIYQKVRRVKGKPARIKLKNIYLVKNKIQTKLPSQKDVVKMLNVLEKKKVFLNNKRLSKNQLLNLKVAIKKDLAVNKDINLGKELRKLYKNTRVTSKSGYTSVVRIQRIKDKIVILPSHRKGQFLFKLHPKGKYVEFGYSKFRIPTIQKRIIIKKVPITKISKKFRKIDLAVSKIKVRKIKAPRASLKLVMKKGISKAKIIRVKNSVKSIQTIIRPRVRAGRLTKTMPLGVVKILMGRIGILLPLLSSKNVQALKAIQANLRASANIQAIKTITETTLKQIQALQSASVKAIQAISLPKLITPGIKFITGPGAVRKPSAKKALAAVPRRKKKRRKRKVAVRKDLGFITTINKIPILKERAFDIVAYALVKKKLRRAIISKSLKRVSREVLKRKLKSIPTGFFKRNRKKFILRKLKGREAYEMVERKIKRIGIKKKVSNKRKRKVKRRRVAKKRTPKRRRIVRRRKKR